MGEQSSAPMAGPLESATRAAVDGADLHRRALALAVRQAGVVRRRQLEELGAGTSTIATWVRRGTWVPYGRRVLVLAGTAMDLVTRSLIVAQQLGADACLTGVSALAVRGVLGDPPWDGLRLGEGAAGRGRGGWSSGGRGDGWSGGDGWDGSGGGSGGSSVGGRRGSGVREGGGRGSGGAGGGSRADRPSAGGRGAGGRGDGTSGSARAVLAWPDDPLGAEEVWVLYAGSRRVAARVIRRAEEARTSALGVRVAPAMTVMLDLLRYLPEQRARNLAMRAAGTPGWSERMARLDLDAARLGGGRGAARLRRLARLVESQARSEAEVVAQELVRSAGLIGWSPNYSVRIGGRRIIIDLALVPAKIAVEIDGLAFHGADRRQADLARQNLLVGAGWTVLRFTWEDLTMRPERVVGQIRAAVEVWERDCAAGDGRGPN